MESQKSIHQFSKRLMVDVRDEAIRDCDVLLDEKCMIKSAILIREAIKNGDMKAAAEMLISETVDKTIFRLLKSIDDESMNLYFDADGNGPISLQESGKG